MRNPKFSLKEYFFKRVVLPFKEYFGHKIKNILIRDILQRYKEFFKTIKHYLINNGEAPLFSSKSSYPLQGGEWIILILMSFFIRMFSYQMHIFNTKL